MNPAPASHNPFSRGWSTFCRLCLNEQRRGGTEVYAYFNNDVGGHAPRDAVTLRRLLEATG